MPEYSLANDGSRTGAIAATSQGSATEIVVLSHESATANLIGIGAIYGGSYISSRFEARTYPFLRPLMAKMGGVGAALILGDSDFGSREITAEQGARLELGSRTKNRPGPLPIVDAGRSPDGSYEPCPPNEVDVDLVPPSKPHKPCIGDHWHCIRYNQTPNCRCFPKSEDEAHCLDRGEAPPPTC